MEPLQEWQAIVSAEDGLCLRIGRVARAHVDLDLLLRHVYATLASPGLGVYLASDQNSTAALVRDIRLMLTKGTDDERVLRAAKATLDAASQAGDLRNRAIHDLWIPEPVEEPDEMTRWRPHQRQRGHLAFAPAPEPSDVKTLDETLTMIERTSLRVGALGMVAHRVIVGAPPSFQPDESSKFWNVEANLRVMEDRFDYLGDRAYRIHGDDWKPKS